jgi:hypothetical protein
MMFAGRAPASCGRRPVVRCRQYARPPAAIRLVAGLAVVQPRFAEIETGTVLVDTNLGLDCQTPRRSASHCAAAPASSSSAPAITSTRISAALRRRPDAAVAPIVAASRTARKGRWSPSTAACRGFSPSRCACSSRSAAQRDSLSALAGHLGKSLADAEPGCAAWKRTG